MQHTPPSTYILRELLDIPVADSVPWWPGFEYLPSGWWYVITLLCLITFILSMITIRHLYQNRYRREAMTALTRIVNPQQKVELATNLNVEQHNALQLFYLLKQVLIYIEPQTAKLADTAVLQHLDKLIVHTSTNTQHFKWQEQLGQRWIASLYNPNIQLSHSELEILIAQSRKWITSHRNQFARFTPLIFKG